MNYNNMVFLVTIQSIYDKNSKKVRRRIKTTKNTWITNEIANKINLKNEMWKTLTKNKNELDPIKMNEYGTNS